MYKAAINPGVRWDGQRWPEEFHTDVEEALDGDDESSFSLSIMSFGTRMPSNLKEP
jgi:hypothetical protein